MKWFLLGMREFRLAWTTHMPDDKALSSYDKGREWAHRLTFRHWEER
jgi:hypothetical protein